MAQTVGHIDEFTSEQGTGLYSNLPGANGSIIIHAGRKVLRYGQYSILQCSYLIQVIEPSTKCYFLPLELQPFCAELLGKQKVFLFFFFIICGSCSPILCSLLPLGLPVLKNYHTTSPYGNTKINDVGINCFTLHT